MIFIYDRDYNQVGVLDVDYTLIHAIGKVRKLNFESTVEIPKGHYIVIQKEGKYYEFVVVDADYSRSGTYIHRYHCQDTVTELQGYYIEEDRPKLNHREHITNILKGTQWTLSTTTNYGDTKPKQMYHFRKNVFETFKKIIDKYELEWYTQFEFSENKITKREIVINKLGKKSNSRLEFEKNIVNFTRRILPEPVYTALVGLGKEIQEEGESSWIVETALRRLDFKDINNGLMYVENLEAKEKYGIGEKGKKQHFTGVVIFNDEEDSKVLLQRTKDELDILSKPRAEYEIDVANLNINVTLGDEVPAIDNVIDFRNYLRVIKIEETARQKILTFGVITQGFSSVNAIRMEEMKESMNVTLVTAMESIMNELSQQYLNEDGYTYNLEIGNEYGLPAGIYSFNKPIDQDPTKVVYMGAGKVLISNKKGTDGAWIWQTAITGDGVVGSTLTTGSVTANKLAADVGQSLDLSSNESITLKVKSTTKDYIDKNKDQLKGDKGDKGDKGADGKDGVAGKDGKGINSTVITYMTSTSGTTAPTTGWSATVPTLTKGQYLWTRTIWTYTDSTTETGYSVSYIAKDGNTGKDGIAGKDGTGIKTTVIQYAKHTNGTQAPSTGWQNQVPSVPDGEYLWTKTTWNYTDGTSETGYSVSKMGEQGIRGLQGVQGAKGDRGLPGAKGADGKTSYTHIAYADTATGEGFSQDPANKSYIGIYVDFIKEDSETPSKYKWTLIKGADGADGIPGAKGADGKTPYLHIAYANSEDGKKDFSVSDSNRSYIGQYTDYTKADSTDPTKYTWSLIKGADGVGIKHIEPLYAYSTSATPDFEINRLVYEEPNVMVRDFENQWVDIYGKFVPSTLHERTDYIKINAGDTVNLFIAKKGQASDSGFIRYGFYDVDKVLISRAEIETKLTNHQRVAPSNASYIVVSAPNDSNTTVNINGNAITKYYPHISKYEEQEILWTSYGVGRNLLENNKWVAVSSLNAVMIAENQTLRRKYAKVKISSKSPETINMAIYGTMNKPLMFRNRVTNIGIETFNSRTNGIVGAGSTRISPNETKEIKHIGVGRDVHDFIHIRHQALTANPDGLDRFLEFITYDDKLETPFYLDDNTVVETPYTISPANHEARKTDHLWERQMIIFTDGRVELTEPSPVHLPDYTQFRTEYETELNVLQGKIDSKVAIKTYDDNNKLVNEKFTQIEQTTEDITSAVSDNAFKALEGLEEEIIQKLGSKLSKEEIEELIKDLKNQNLEVSSRITQTNKYIETEFKGVKTIVKQNGATLEKLTSTITSGQDEDGNTYTEWGSTGKAKVRVGADGIDMVSADQETMTFKDGEAYAKALYVTETIGFGNHIAQKYGNEYTIFSWNGGE